jgi:hypothetical protein
VDSGLEPGVGAAHRHGAARLAGLVYGTIVALAVIIAVPPTPDLWRALGLVVGTNLALWLAHVYAHVLAESITAGRRATGADVRHMAQREIAVVLAVVLPSAALLLGAVGVLAEHTAVWCAFGLGVATLVGQGLAYARLERLGRLGTAIAVGINVGVALVLVVLKVLVSH